MKRVAHGSFKNITFKVFRDAENNEFVTKYYINNKKYEDGDYFTSDKQDAINTGESEIRFMHSRLSGNKLNCGYCNQQKLNVSPMLSNGYRICKECMAKYGWTTIDTMADAEAKRREESEAKRRIVGSVA